MIVAALCFFRVYKIKENFGILSELRAAVVISGVIVASIVCSTFEPRWQRGHHALMGVCMSGIVGTTVLYPLYLSYADQQQRQRVFAVSSSSPQTQPQTQSDQQQGHGQSQPQPSPPTAVDVPPPPATPHSLQNARRLASSVGLELDKRILPLVENEQVFSALLDFAATEFSTENLYFLQRVAQFAQMIENEGIEFEKDKDQDEKDAATATTTTGSSSESAAAAAVEAVKTGLASLAQFSRELYTEFIQPGSPSQINISSSLRHLIQLRLRNLLMALDLESQWAANELAPITRSGLVGGRKSLAAVSPLEPHDTYSDPPSHVPSSDSQSSLPLVQVQSMSAAAAAAAAAPSLRVQVLVASMAKASHPDNPTHPSTLKPTNSSSSVSSAAAAAAACDRHAWMRVFDPAVREVARLIANDTLPRFWQQQQRKTGGGGGGSKQLLEHLPAHLQRLLREMMASR